jgi:hypothetical protein
MAISLPSRIRADTLPNFGKNETRSSVREFSHLMNMHELPNSPAQEMLFTLTPEPHIAPFLVWGNRHGNKLLDRHI